MKMRRTSLMLLLGTLALPAAATAQTSAAAGQDDAGYYFLLGRHYESSGEVEKAIAAHKQAIALAPTSAEALAELAALYARQERPLEAIETAEAALKLDPQNREANRTSGSIYAALSEQRKPLRAGESPQLYAARAIAALERARQGSGPPELGLELTLGRLYLRAESYDKAIPVLKRVVDEQPGYPEAALLLASAQEGAGSVPDAIETLRNAVDQNPRFARGVVMLAELSEKQGEWKQAAEAYARAQRLNMRGIDFTTRQAAALLNAGEAAAARDVLKPGAAKPDVDPVHLYLLASALRQTGDLAAAEETAKTLRAKAPDDPRGLYVMAQILEARGDHPGAEQSLRELLKRDPIDATALNYLGYMFAERGQKLDEAVELVQRALKIEPGNPSFLDSLGWAYFQQGKLDLADTPLTEAAEKLPKNSVIQDHLGDLRFRQRRYADAVAAWERSLAGDGESIDRAKVQKKLEDARARMGAR